MDEHLKNALRKHDPITPLLLKAAKAAAEHDDEEGVKTFIDALMHIIAGLFSSSVSLVTSMKISKLDDMWEEYMAAVASGESLSHEYAAASPKEVKKTLELLKPFTESIDKLSDLLRKNANEYTPENDAACSVVSTKALIELIVEVNSRSMSKENMATMDEPNADLMHSSMKVLVGLFPATRRDSIAARRKDELTMMLKAAVLKIKASRRS